MRRKFYWLLTLAVLYVGFRVAANQLLGFALQSAFAGGTGCAVGLSNPRLSFWPLMGTVQNVSIVSPKEAATAGFRAEEISVHLDLAGLFSKEILLRDLKLSGARVDSVGTDTGFYNTLNFLFADSPPSSGGIASFFFSDWHIHIPSILIYGTAGQAELPGTDLPGSNRLRLQHGPVNFLWNEAVVTFIEPHSDRNEPYDFIAAGSDMRIQFDSAAPISFGKLSSDGRIGQGKVIFNQALVTSASPEPDHKTAESAGIVTPAPTRISGSGIIYLGDRDEFDLSIDANVGPETINSFDRSGTGGLAGFHPVLTLSGRLTGKLDQPQFSGPVRLSAGEASPAQQATAAAANCLGGTFSANLDLNVTGAALSGISLDAGAAIGTAEVRFEEHFPYKFSMQANPQQVAALHQRCRQDRLAADVPLPAGKPVTANIKAALDLNLRGSISPLTVIGSVSAVTYPLQSLVSFFEVATGEEPHFGPLTLNSLTDFDAHGTFEINPSTTKSSGALAFDLRNAELLDTVLRTASAELRFDGDRVELIKGLAAGDLGEAEVKGVIPFHQKITVSGVIKNLALQALPPVAKTLPMITTSGSGTFDLTGTLDDPEAVAALVISASGIEQRNRVWQSKLQLKTAKGRLSGTAAMFGDTARAQFDLPLDSESPEEMRIGVKAARFPLGEIVSYFKSRNQSTVGEGLESRSEGELTGELNLTAPRNDMLAGSGQLLVQTMRVVENGVPINNTRPIVVQIQNSRAVFADFEIAAAEKTARLTGYVDRRSGWNAMMSGAWELESLIPVMSGIEQMSGAVKAEILLRGPVASPELVGKFGVENGSISFPLGSSIYGIEQAKVDGTIDATSLKITSFKGQFGEGTISGTGEILTPLDSETRRLQAAVQFGDLQLEPANNLSVNLGGNITLAKVGSDPLIVGGEIDVKSALYQDNIDLLQMIRSVTRYLSGSTPTANRRTFNSGGSGSAGVVLDLAIRSENTILIDTDIVQAELKSQLRVSGPVAAPLVDGDLTVVDGQFGFKANQFEILIGKILFSSASGTTDPRLNILGETSISSQTQEETRISLLVQGTLSNPTVTFSSDRGLSPTEIVGLLGIGSAIDSRDFRANGEDLSLVQILNPVSGASLAERIASLTGLRNIRLESGISPETGEIVPTVHATKPLVGKLILDLQSDLTGRNSAADVDYRLTPFFSLITGWKSYSATHVNSSTGGFNLGVRYRDSFPGLRLFPRSIKQSRISRKEE